MLELQAQPDGFGVRHPGRDVGLGRQAVADNRGDRFAGQEPGAAGGEEDGAVEIDLLAKGDLEVGQAHAQVVELQDASNTDLAATARGLGHRVRPGIAAWLVDQLGFADVEAIGVHNQARAAVARIYLPGDTERREGNRRLLHHQQFLARSAVGRRIVIGIPVEDDAAGGDLERVRDLDAEAGNLDAELARHAEGIQQVAAAGDRTQCFQDIDADVEGAEQAGQLGGDTAAGLALRALAAAKAQRGHVHANSDSQEQLAVLELGLGQGDGRALQ